MRIVVAIALLAVAALMIVGICRAQQPAPRAASDFGNVTLTVGAVRVVIDPRGSVTVFHPAGGAISTRPGFGAAQSVTEIGAPAGKVGP